MITRLHPGIRTRNGMHMRLPLREGTGTTSRDPIGGHDAALTNSPAWSAYRGVYSLDLVAASSQALNCGAGVLAGHTGSFTTEAWVEFDLIDLNHHTVMAKDDRTAGDLHYQIQIDPTDKLAAYVWDDSASAYLGKISTSVLSAATLYHIVMVYNSSGPSVTLYLNNATQGTAYSGGSFTAVDNTAAVQYIGRHGADGTSNRYTDGHIWPTTIWTRALTAAEVDDRYNRGLAP